jgi:pimeloyl-ACP methyl ester carboxylesterase
MVRGALPYADAILETAEGKRRATRLLTVEYEHIPPQLLAHQMRAVAAAEGRALVQAGLGAGEWSLDAQRIGCPVRVVWGTEDRLLPWPSAAARFRTEWLPHADWVVLDGVGHAPQLDVPLEASQMIVDFTG